MDKKFRNKYRISSVRLQSWDYSANGAYFLTICTANRENYFGKVVNGEMILNDLGLIAQNIWLEIPVQFPFVELGNFVIMPNHIHGILIINNKPVETRFIACQIESEEKVIQKKGGITGIKNPMLHQNISTIIRWYKGRCTFEINKISSGFKWQPRFYDHIIRNSKSFENIQKYIENNPENWDNDSLK
ncbi:REP element-mobilizing transposase RayT [Halpernia humi]|uniref:REP element-mobilizing transposase RayT n=1 Tax=Halpernia humi TaxID=493375 RepID=A0A1H5YVW5_9FLAO|nr:transposase [Halpernia humi]SEG28439.1 REP element-mobilizing transposase RayT [Halpernia humi]